MIHVKNAVHEFADTATIRPLTNIMRVAVVLWLVRVFRRL